ncbi:MAG: amidohydrolase [Anaerolineae bacterium]|nr:amidohydrolase [Anaerolineae bacterium]
MTRPHIVNFHEHPSPAVEQRCQDLGIDFAVLLPVGPDAALRARQMVHEHPTRYAAFHWVDMARDPDEEARRLRRAVARWGVKGVKFQPMDQHLYANDRRLYPIYEVCEELDLVVTWHMGVVYLGPYMYELGVPMLARYCDPIYLDEVAFDFPDLKLCIAHLGGNHMYTALILCEKHANVYLDTAFLGHFGPRFFPPTTPTALIEHAVRVVGADKVLYGSEGVTPEEVLDSALSDEDKAKVLGLNAVRLLGLDPDRTPRR